MNLNKRENSGFEKQLYTGFGTFDVLAINPTKAQIGEIYGYTPKDEQKEPEYEGKDANGDEYIDIVFYLKSKQIEGFIHPQRFRLIDKDVVSEKEVNGIKESKYQYVNQTGGSSYSDSEKNLLDWFTHFQSKERKNLADKIVRVAIKGEANYYNFLTKWLSKVDYFKTDTTVLLDKKAAFRNIEKYVNSELRPILQMTGDDSVTAPVGALATVYTGEKDGQPVHYQNLYSEFFADWQMKNINVAIKAGWNDKKVEKIYKGITDEKYGIKDAAYTLTELQPFNPSEHIQATNTTFIPASDNGSDVDDASY